MPLASGTIKDENSLTCLSLSGLTRQSIPPQADPIRSLAAYGFRLFAGMTFIDWLLFS
jgi:hypothetical protein